MPFGNKTGPTGMGPMTGRGAGYCAGSPVPGYTNATPGPGSLGRGRGGGGGGRGRRNRCRATGLTGWQRAGMDMPAVGVMPEPPAQAAPYPGALALGMTTEQELDALNGQAEYFEGTLEEIRKRIEELRAETTQAVDG